MGAWLIMALNSALLGVCCFLVANVVTQIGAEALEPAPTDPTRPRAETGLNTLSAAPSLILERNLFGAQLVGDTQVEELEVQLTATKLPLRLLGTAAASHEPRSRASIEDTKTKKHMVVAVGDSINGHARVKVTHIERARVILDNAGRPEELALHEDNPKRQPRKAKRRARQARRVPKRTKLNDRLASLAGDDGQGIARILSSARIVPFYDQGEMRGMKVDAIKADSVFEKIGFQNGDIITEVNGIVIDRVEATNAIFDEFATADVLNTSVTRGEATLSFSATADELTE